jgi:phosphoglycerol transferase MdoB-like AlkP superfamily enzyme
MPKSRYSIVLMACAVNMLSSMLLRAALCVASWGHLEHSLGNILKVFGLGLFYDIAFNIYFSLFFSMVLLLVPDRIFYSRFFKWTGRACFLAFLAIVYFGLVAEWLFWAEFNTRLNFIAVDYLVYGTELTMNMYESYPVYYIFAGILAAALATFAALRPCLERVSHVHEPFRRRLAIASSIVAAAAACFLFVGQAPRDSIVNNYARELSSNGIYQLVAAFRNNTLDYDVFYARGDDARLSGLLKTAVAKNPGEGELFDISRNVSYRSPELRLNVVLVSVESLSAEFLARFGNRQGITPFLDEWRRQCLFFTDLYATGTRTDRGLEAITLSIPPTPGRSLVKRPDNAHLHNLGHEFRKRGYDVAFLYGGRGYFDNMNEFFSGNGYRIIDQTDLDSSEITFKNAWGVADEDLYGRTLKEADAAYRQGTPFFFHVMTTSNHRPFTYPEGRIDIPSGTGRPGAVKYTDSALNGFISAAKNRKWFADTVFVVVADHCAGSAGDVGLPLRKYHIPLFIYCPKHIRPGEVHKTASQIDIAPTLLGLLRFGYESYFWGSDILSGRFVERALIGNYQKLGLYKDETLVILSPRRLIDVMEQPLVRDRIRKAAADEPACLETMAYYQGADYVLRHRMNRWEYVRHGAPVIAHAAPHDPA